MSATKKKFAADLARHVFLWIALFYNIHKKENARIKNQEWHWFIGGISLCLLIVLLWLSLAFKYNAININVGSFLFMGVVLTIIMNFIAKRRWQPRDFSRFLNDDKLLPHLLAPDSQNGRFALAWNKAQGWIMYGYREKSWEPEDSANHVAIFGEKDQRQNHLVARMIAQSWDHAPARYARSWLFPWRKKVRVPARDCSTVVLCLDSDRAGLNFNLFRNVLGVIIIDDDTNTIAGALLQICRIIENRANDFQAYGKTRILLVTEDLITECFLGKSKELDHVKDALETILRLGKDYGVHLILSANPELAFESLKSQIRHYLLPIKFFTSAKYKVTKDGNTVEAKTDTPKYFRDQVLLYHRGGFHESKLVYQDQKSIMDMAQDLTLTTEAANLAQIFRDRSFPPAKKVKRVSPVRIHDGLTEVTV